MLFIKSVLEERLHSQQLRYDELFRVSQVVNETEKRVYQAMLDSVLADIASVRKDLEPYQK